MIPNKWYKTINRYKWFQKHFDRKLIQCMILNDFLVFSSEKNEAYSWLNKHNNNINPILPLLPVPDWPHWPLNYKRLAFYKTLNATLHKILNLGFWAFRSIFFKECSIFSIVTLFLYLWLSVWVDICIINTWR